MFSLFKGSKAVSGQTLSPLPPHCQHHQQNHNYQFYYFSRLCTLYWCPRCCLIWLQSYLSKSTLWPRFSTTIANLSSWPKIQIEKYNSYIEQRAEEKNWRLLLLSRYKNPLTSHVRTHFFFSLLIRNNYVTYLLLKYSVSPLANRHEIFKKKITSPRF